MSVLAVNTFTTGLADVTPQVIQIETNDTLDNVQVTGYLNSLSQVYHNVFSDQQMALVYTSNVGHTRLRFSISGGNISLVPVVEAGGNVTGVGITGSDFTITNSPITLRRVICR